MACYTFTVNNHEYKVSSPNIGGETQLQNFIKSLLALKDSEGKTMELRDADEAMFSRLVLDIQNLTLNKNAKMPDVRDNSNIPYLIKNNLRKYGITMHVYSKEKWESFCNDYNKDKEVKLDPNARSFFLNGEIYVQADKFSVNDSIHELSHLLLAVMRSTDFNKYRDFIHTFYLHPKVQQIAKALTTTSAYSDNYDLDFEEEAVVRYLEGLFTGDESFGGEFTLNGHLIDTMQLINDAFKDTVMKTFGIKNFPGMSILFKSLVCDIPQFGSEMFIPQLMSTTGYLEMKTKAIEAEGITALINYYSSDEGGNRIIKGDCI